MFIFCILVVRAPREKHLPPRYLKAGACSSLPHGPRDKCAGG